MMGRPTKWSEEVEKKALAYVGGGYAHEGHAIPSIAGMAVVLDVCRDTLYDWANDPGKNFSYILSKCNTQQEMVLLNGGLRGDFNAQITKLALGKQGYSDKVESDNKHAVDLSGASDEQLRAIIGSKS